MRPIYWIAGRFFFCLTLVHEKVTRRTTDSSHLQESDSVVVVCESKTRLRLPRGTSFLFLCIVRMADNVAQHSVHFSLDHLFSHNHYWANSFRNIGHGAKFLDSDENCARAPKTERGKGTFGKEFVPGVYRERSFREEGKTRVFRKAHSSTDCWWEVGSITDGFQKEIFFLACRY